MISKISRISRIYIYIYSRYSGYFRYHIHNIICIIMYIYIYIVSVVVTRRIVNTAIRDNLTRRLNETLKRIVAGCAACDGIDTRLASPSRLTVSSKRFVMPSSSSN